METPGDRNEAGQNKNNNNKKKTVIRVVKKIVKKKVIKKVPKPKPESKTESLLGVSSSNCDSFGSNCTSSVMGIEKAVENGDSSHSGRIEVKNVKEEDEKGVCLVENGDSSHLGRIEVKNVKEEGEKGVCLVENGDSSHSGRIEVKNVKEEDEKGVCLVENGYTCEPDQIEPKVSEFDNVKEAEVRLVERNESEINSLVSDHNRVDDNDAMDIKGQEGEEGVNEGVVNDTRAVMDIEKTVENIQEPGVKEEEAKGACLVKNGGKLREFENVKDVEVCLVEKNGFERDESEINSLVTSYLVSNQNGVELQDNDTMDVKGQEGEEGVNKLMNIEKTVENNHLSDRDRIVPKIEKLDAVAEKLSEFENVKDESEINGLVTSYLVNVQNGVELQDIDQNENELQISDQNRVEDNDAMDVKVNEGEEGVKELVVDTENEGTELHEGLGESRVLSGQMLASWWHMKQRRKIFVHGLDKETKEDDIRKVFEKIGEVVEVKLITNFNSGKSRGFGFVRYASADLAELALTKLRHVEIRGSTWHTAAVEPSDTILLNNIDKKWNNENVLSLLQKVGITKIDEVSVVPDPENSELNRGFAFIEFETKRDAQMAYRKLQIKNIFGEYSKIKVTWAESLADPVEEEMSNAKSVFAEFIPSSWDEKEVKDHFKRFGEIESVALAKNLYSAKRNDFAFINYKTCQAALSCIEALNNKSSTGENGPKAHPKVSLAKSTPKGKPVKIKSESAVTEVSKVNQLSNQSRPSHVRYQNASQSTPFHSPYHNASQSRPSHSPYQNASHSKPSHSAYQYASQSRPSHSPYQNASKSRPSHSPYQNASQSRGSHSRYQNADQLRPSQGISGVYQPQKAIRSEVPSVVRHEASRKDEGSSTTNELVQLLREQASWKLGGPSSTAGMSTGHPQSQSGGKQLQLPTDLMQGRSALYLDPRSYHQTHLQMANPTQPRPIVASPHYDQQRAHYTHGYSVVEPNPRYIQKRDHATYPGNGSRFYR